MATSQIIRIGSGLYQLTLHGQFAHPHWVAFLFASLADQQVSVVSGRAAQTDLQQWEACLDLDFRRSTAAPDALDYEALARRRPPSSDLSLPRLTAFTLMRQPHGLEARLEGPDQIGFLGRLLNRVCLLGLFPVEIKIATHAGQIRDAVVFQSIGNAVPDAAVEATLRSTLQAMVTGV